MVTRSKPGRNTRQSRRETTKQSASDSRGPTAARLVDRLSWSTVAILTFCAPLLIAPAAKNQFRLPKELLLVGGGIILLALFTVELLLSGRVRRSVAWPGRILGWTAALLVWSAVTLMLSTNAALSTASLIYLVSAIVFFLASLKGAPGKSLAVLYLLLVPAAINAAIAIMQRIGIWTPVHVDVATPDRLKIVALLGNPNDIGMSLLAPCLAAFALAVTSRTQRVAAVSIALLTTAGVLVTETLGAIVALGAGVFLICVRVRPRLTAAIFALVLLSSIMFVRLSPVRWERTQTKFASASQGDLDPFLSGRLTPFLAAWRMFRKHPAAGVGIGCFAFQYFDEKIALEKDIPWLANRNTANFGEVHNEHLQILAESGLAGYILFLTAIGFVGKLSLSRRVGTDSDVATFARAVALPLAAAFFILALSSFPLRLAAPTISFLFLSALIVAWSEFT